MKLAAMPNTIIAKREELQVTEIGRTVSGQRAIEFKSGSVVLRGWLRIPDGAGPHPLVILAHGMGGLKEWEIPAFASAFVAARIAAMTFDYRNFGDSDGTPREEVDHCGQVEDFQNAITLATTLPEIDHARIGLWGTSLGGRNVLAVAALDQRVKCVLAQVPGIFPEGFWLHHGASSCSGGDVAQFYRDLTDDRRDRALGKEPRYLVYQPDPSAEHYQRGLAMNEEELRNAKGRLTIRSFEPTLALDIVHLMTSISPKPMRMVLTERDVLLAGQMEAYNAALEPKSLIIFPGHHYDLYPQGKDRETTGRDKAIADARDWFVQQLA